LAFRTAASLGYSPCMENERRETRRWLAGRRAAAARESAELRLRPVTPEESLALALALIDFAAERHGWPLRTDAHEDADDLAFHETWARVRKLRVT
jgi:hypothetical protein